MDELLEGANKAIEQLQIDPQPEPKEESQLNEESQPSQEEQLARQSGWRPKEEWDSSKGEWIDADEFNRRGPLFDTIGKLKDEIRDYKKSADALIEHNRRLEEHAREAEKRGRDKAIKELEERRIEAVQDGDIELFQEIDKELAEYREEDKKPTKVDEVEIDPSIKDWVSKNEWFEKDEAMTSYMIHKQNEFLGKGLSIPEALEKSTEAVKREFSFKFSNPNKDKPNAVMGKVDSASNRSYTINDLPPQYRPVYQAISRKMEMPLKEYINQLKELGAM